MNLLVPAALAFGIIIPIILVFYFLRPKRQERVIGSTLLWQQALQDVQASRPWQRLRITPLLLLQILAAIIIVLVLTRPAIFTGNALSGDTIVVLQTSASMQATDVAPSRFQDAKNQISDFIDALGTGDHLSLITMAHTPEVLITQSQNKSQLHAALNRAQVTNQDADLGQALSLATSLTAGHSDAQILVVGDGHVIPPDQTLVLPIPVRYLRIGTDAPNAALLALASRVVQGNLVALAQVANYSHQQRALPVELYADGRLVSVQTVTLAPGASGSVQWGPLNMNTQFLHAHIISQDAMTIDHDAWAIVGSSIHGRALLVTKGNSFLLAALRQQPGLDLYTTTPDKYNAKTVGNFDLTVFDGFVPATLPDGDLFFVNPPNGSYIFGKVGPQVKISRIDAGEDSIQALNSVDVSSIHVLTASHQLTPALWAQSILTSPETPLLVAGETNNRRIAVLGFDLHDSDLPLQPAFPILMYNLNNWFLPQPITSGQTLAGLPVTVQTWPGAESVTVSSPGKQSTVVGPPFPVLPYNNTNQIGIYSVIQRVHGQDLNGAFAINLFNPSQSQLAPAPQLPVAHSSSFTSNPNNVPRELREIWPWIAAFLLLILCFEWWLFSRTYQQQLANRQRIRRQPTLLDKLSITTLMTRVNKNKDYKKFRKRLTKMLNRRNNTVKKRSATVTSSSAPSKNQPSSDSRSKKGDRHVNV